MAARAQEGAAAVPPATSPAQPANPPPANRALANELAHEPAPVTTDAPVVEQGTLASLLHETSPATRRAIGNFSVSDDGVNTLHIGGFLQTRYVVSVREDPPEGSQEVTNGFELRRTRLNLSGSLWDKDLTFKVEGTFGRNSGAFAITDAFGNYTWDNGVHARWGQFKVPLMREQMVSKAYQVAVERSTVNSEFTQGRSQGVEVGWVGQRWRLTGALSDGINTGTTDFDASGEADYAVTGRSDFLLVGDNFKVFNDFTSWKGSEFAAMTGAAIHWQSGGDTAGTLDATLLQATTDVSLEGDGWSAFAEGVWRRRDSGGGGGGGGEVNDFGVVAQAAFFVSEQCELFARYDVVIPDIGDNFNTATAGFNYYLSPRSHAVKFTADAVWYFDAVTQTPILTPGTSLPLLSDSEGNQLAFRLQFLVMF